MAVTGSHLTKELAGRLEYRGTASLIMCIRGIPIDLGPEVTQPCHGQMEGYSVITFRVPGEAPSGRYKMCPDRCAKGGKPPLIWPCQRHYWTG